MKALEGLIHEHGKLGQAWFSPDHGHRYLLLRGGEIDDTTPLVSFVMLNPSTADADSNDRTIAKCIKFALKFGAKRGWFNADHAFDGLPIRVAVANLYAVRATDPDVAFAHPRPIGGPKNDEIILELAHKSNLVIAAWGADARSTKRAREVYRLLRDEAGAIILHRLGNASKDGSPKHPLYLKDATELEVHSW